MGDISRWLTTHTQGGEEQILSIKDSIEALIKETPWTGKPSRIPTGIRPIDEWSFGGLRPGQLGIIIAPTGGGKSSCLLNIAYNMALKESRQVLLLTNELSRDAQTERFLARMQGDDGSGKFVPLQVIQDDPVAAYKGLDFKWGHDLHKRLLLGAIPLNATAEQIEADLVRLKAEYGFDPEVLVIDYMEKLAPIRSVRLEKEWIYLAEIAKELISLGQRRKLQVWTAVQTNRQGLSRNGGGPSLDTVQGSIRHLQAADVVVSCKKVFVQLDSDGDTQIECLEFAEHKMRSAALMDRTMLVRTKLENMLITNEEIIPPSDDNVVDEDEREEDQQERKTDAASNRGGRSVKSPRESK